MDRKDFLKNLFGDVVYSAKEVITPLIEDDLKKVDKSTDLIVGEEWEKLPDYQFNGKSWIVRDYNLASKSFYIVISENKEIAFRKQCPVCKGLITITEFDKKCKCFVCDKSRSLETDEGDLVIEEVPLRTKNGKLEYLAKVHF